MIIYIVFDDFKRVRAAFANRSDAQKYINFHNKNNEDKFYFESHTLVC